MSREEKLQRIVNECNKVAVVKFMAQPSFKESSVAEWARASGVDVTSSSKKVIAENFYDVLMAKTKSGRAENGPAFNVPSKRAREINEVGDGRPTKMAKIDAGDVSQILGLCKPEAGLERPIRWKVSLTDGSETTLTSVDLLSRGPFHLINFFEKKILAYLDEK